MEIQILFGLMATMHQPNHWTLRKNTYEFFLKVLSFPMLWISPEKNLEGTWYSNEGFHQKRNWLIGSYDKLD